VTAPRQFLGTLTVSVFETADDYEVEGGDELPADLAVSRAALSNRRKRKLDRLRERAMDAAIDYFAFIRDPYSGER